MMVYNPIESSKIRRHLRVTINPPNDNLFFLKSYRNPESSLLESFSLKQKNQSLNYLNLHSFLG